MTPTWPTGQTITTDNFNVTLTAPVLVNRSKGYCWFPSMVVLSNGDLMATMSNYADVHTEESTSFNCFSNDGGRTWSPPIVAPYGEAAIRLPNGDQIFLPYYMWPRPCGMGAPYKRVPAGTNDLLTENEILVTGWPRADRKVDEKLTTSGFVFNGDPVALKDGGYLATLYGNFEDDKRYNLVAAYSQDGLNWTIRSIVADHNCELAGVEGPCESAMGRLKDGRIMCVFRLESNVPLGQTWSDDEGLTWTKPVAMNGPFSVQPGMTVMPGGEVAISSGRPGVFLWINADGEAHDWDKIDLVNHHNKYCSEGINPEIWSGSSSYTEVVTLDATTLLVIYDRTPNGWSPLDDGSNDTNSVWVVRATLNTK